MSVPVVRDDLTDFAVRGSSAPADLVWVSVVEFAGADAGVRVVIAMAVVIVATAVSWAK